MSFRSSLPLFALALTCAAPLVVAAPIADASTEATKAFKAEIGARLATLKGELGVLDAQFQTDIDALTAAVKGAVTTPSDAHLDAFDRLHVLHGDVAIRLRTFTDGLESDASAHLVNLTELPDAFVVGHRGLIDDAVRRGVALRERATARNFKRLRLFIAHLDKVHDYGIVVDRRRQELDPITPSGTVTEAAVPFVPLRIDLFVAGSDRNVIADGRVCLAGTADLANGTTVDVSIKLPDGTPVTMTGAVDAQTRRWSVCFPAIGPADLPEGNYSITVTQGSVSFSDSIGVQ